MIDLDSLGALIGVPADTATPLAHRAAVALERRHHPGVHLTGTVRDAVVDEELGWRLREPHTATYEDMNRVTEEGAEAIGLALACSKCEWRIARRLQARLAEGADWLMTDVSTGRMMVLEIGGTDEQDIEALLARKIAQARRSPFAERGTPAACVVRFLDPSVRMKVDDGPRGTEP
jgi:hypothetical protein